MNSGQKKKILTTPELQKLKTWQRRMVITFLLAMLVLVIAFSLELSIGMDKLVEWLLGACFIVLAIAGAVIQFSGKCPNCNYRIGLQSRLVLPEQCTRCKVSFRESTQDSKDLNN